jgi:hypothetical protein
MIKIVLMGLLLLAGLSMIGNFIGGFLRGPKPPPPKLATRAKCAHCGRTVLGTTPCICGKG